MCKQICQLLGGQIAHLSMLSLINEIISIGGFCPILCYLLKIIDA